MAAACGLGGNALPPPEKLQPPVGHCMNVCRSDAEDWTTQWTALLHAEDGGKESSASLDMSTVEISCSVQDSPNLPQVARDLSTKVPAIKLAGMAAKAVAPMPAKVVAGIPANSVAEIPARDSAEIAAKDVAKMLAKDVVTSIDQGAKGIATTVWT